MSLPPARSGAPRSGALPSLPFRRATIAWACATAFAMLSACGGDGGAGGSRSETDGVPPITSAPAAWGTAQALSAPDREALAPSVAASADGSAVAAWRQSDADGITYNLWASRFTPAGGWEAPVLLEADPDPVGDPQVAMDAAGNAVVAWSQTVGGATAIWARHYAAGAGWAPTVRLEPLSGTTNAVSVAMNAAGETVVAWDLLTADFAVRAARFRPAVGWAGPVTLNPPGSASAAKAGIDASGHAVVAWRQRSAGAADSDLFGATAASGGAWSAGVPLDADPASEPSSIRLDVEPGGTALVAWKSTAATVPNRSVRTVRHRPASGWGAVTALAGTADALDPSIAVDTDGSAMAVWSAGGGIHAARSAADGTWSASQRIDALAGAAMAPLVVANGGGTITATWTTNGPWQATYRAASGWESPAALGPTTGPLGSSVAIGSDRAGRGVAAWSMQTAGGFSTLFVNRSR